MNTIDGIHPFERAGLGIAPFKFVGSYESKFQAVPGDPNCPIQPGSSCDYCGNGIMRVCRIRDVNGKEFKVGCDCVAKTGDKRVATDVRREMNRVAREQSHTRDDAKIEAAKAVLPAVAETLRSKPHPIKYMADKGLTLLDSVEWALFRAGRAGGVKAAKIIRAAKGGAR